MINSDVEKSNMPDGSGLLADSIHSEHLLHSINGDQESPIGLPESPEDKGIIRCICGIDEDDGFTIFCDRCSVWQHGACVGIHDEKDAPDKYLCEQCNPRPLDVQKAIRLQRQRQEAEQTTSHKPRRRTTTHPKAKSNSNNATLAPNQSLPPTHGRKEKQQSPIRRTEGKRPRAQARGQSATQVETIANEEVDVVNDEDNDIPFWPTADDYEHRDHNESSPEIQQFLDQRLLQLEDLQGLPQDIERLHSIREYVHKILRLSISKKSNVVYTNFSRQFGIFAGEPMTENDLITDFTGYIGLQADYKNDPINQYSTLQRPKQFVLFSPPNTLDLYVDARLYGNEARYIRRSCFPNARVVLAFVPNGPERGIHFGLFATKNIKTREEITIGHDWNPLNKIEEMIAGVRQETRPLLEVYPPETIRSMAIYANTILVNGDCACRDDHCTFVRLRRAQTSLPDTTSRRNSMGDVDAMSIDRSDDQEGSEIDDDSRPNSRGKPHSRDRTPSKDFDLPKTSREQRKIQQAMARFAQMEEKQKEKSGSDKRKKSDSMDPDDLSTKRKRQLSISSDVSSKPLLQRGSSNKGRSLKRKSMSPSPGADRISESGASLTEPSPKPAGRVPNRVKRSMKGRKEPSSKKVRIEPPDSSSWSPKWVVKPTLSKSWTPPQLLWYKKYVDLAKLEYEQKQIQECRPDEIKVEPEPVAATIPPVSELKSPQQEDVPPAKVSPNLRVSMPSPSFSMVSEQTPVLSATPSQMSTSSYFPTSAASLSFNQPLASPGTPLTPKRISLADYRARRASGIVTPSTANITDPMSGSQSESFAVPPAPSKSPELKSAEAPPS